MAYVQTHFNCVTQEIVRPDKPIPFPDLNLPTPHPDSNDDLPDEDGPYDERERKPPDSYRDWWYHSDHLGSSTYLTDNFGRPSHYYETLPFGEMIVEHNQSSFYDNAYKFNGKELDEATQMYYYGARYYDPRLSIFVSVDPLAEQTMTPYQYVHNNPINLIDPTGMSAENGDGGGWISRTWNNAKSLFSSSDNSQTDSSPIGHTELDEVTVDANRKPNWFQRNFSKHKLSNDWKNIKEKSGFNHFKSYKKDMVEKRHFDAWGNILLVQDGQNNNLDGLTFIERGYTGHEHLQGVDLINMNARLYDARLHRFLAPDSFIQEPDNPQSYNRYGYALNNPLKYTDPSGEFLIGFISGLIKGIANGGNIWRTGIETGVNEMKILWGMFKTDPNKTFGGQVWEVVSRFTWQSPQVLAGNIFSNISNWAWQVDNVDYKYGATVISGNFWGSDHAVTLGNFINGSRYLAADPNNSLFQHEYGHYLQSQAMGPAYLQRVGFPSLLSKGSHKFHAVEQDANRRAFKYFNKEVRGFYQTEEEFRNNLRNGIRIGWDFQENPLNIHGTNERGQYVDYRDPEQFLLLEKLSIRAMWYDYLDTFIPAGINTFYYNNR